MIWIHSITESVCVYLSAVMLIHCSPTDACHSIRAPTIDKIAHKRLANGYRLTCKVNPGGLKDETLVYWLADGDFIEKVYKNINVTKTERKSPDGKEFLHTKVVFTDVSQEDFHTVFTCVALSPVGFAKKNVLLKKDRRH
ncbi:hypothetical protein KOW79_015612 [Hemibagrus wyckioides]|uniref:Ig-like domain-containing protein n=1 Tax=Hemibagrus wyckioides TaxID=337641 RepID=A0A9D3NI37_9TELE|nr:interleukin-1 receptor type 2-like [Hemibagrus wyckioides]KAG7321197.1 hypothetical protein KOW79_015612 [Hemibagrus wyckioides]